MGPVVPSLGVPSQPQGTDLYYIKGGWSPHLHRQDHIAAVLQHLFYSVIEVGVTHTGTVQPREKIRYEAQEERHIFKHKLGQVHVPQGSHENHILGAGEEGGEGGQQ